MKSLFTPRITGKKHCIIKKHCVVLAGRGQISFCQSGCVDESATATLKQRRRKIVSGYSSGFRGQISVSPSYYSAQVWVVRSRVVCKRVRVNQPARQPVSQPGSQSVSQPARQPVSQQSAVSLSLQSFPVNSVFFRGNV